MGCNGEKKESVSLHWRGQERGRRDVNCEKRKLTGKTRGGFGGRTKRVVKAEETV